MTPADLLKNLRDLGDEGALFDAGGPNVKAMAEGFATLPGEAKARATKFLEERAKGAQSRIIAQIVDVVKNKPLNLEKLRAEAQRRMRQLGAQYEETLYRQQVPATEALVEVLERPMAQRALAKAQETAADRGNPSFIEFLKKNEQGELVWAKKPTIEVLDFVVRNLSEMIDDASDAVTGKLSSQGVSAVKLKQTLVQEIENAAPAYAVIRKNYADENAQIRAMDLGKKFLREDADAILDRIDEFSGAELEMFQIGAAKALTDQVKSRVAERAQWMPNTLQQERISAVFGGRADNILKQIKREGEFAANKHQALANSRTEIRRTSVDDLARVPVAAANLAAGRPLAAAGQLVGGTNRGRETMSADAARMLFDSNPQVRAELMRQLQQRRTGLLSEQPDYRQFYSGIAGTVGPSAGIIANQ